MRTLRLLLAVGLGLAPTLAAATAGTVPAFAGGGAGMTLTATMDGQDQRLLVGTQHTVHITLADTPGEASLRHITISLSDLDPHPLPVVCPAGQNGSLALEPGGSLQCTALVTAQAGFRTLVARAVAFVPGDGSLLRTDPLHYEGFMPPPPAPVAHAPLTPGPASGRPPHTPVVVTPPPLDPPDPPDPAPVVQAPVKVPVKTPVAPVAPVKTPAAPGCPNGTEPDDSCCGAHSTVCCPGHAAAGSNRCCGSPGKSGDCVRHGGLAFTGLSTPLLIGATTAGLLLVAGGCLLIRRFGRR
jgi:hypothetical protein